MYKALQEYQGVLFYSFENHVDFVLQPACQLACLPASQPAVRPGCTRCRTLKITQNNRLLHRIYETVVLKTILLSFLALLSSLSTGMRKQLASPQLASPQYSIHGVNREVNAPAVL